MTIATELIPRLLVLTDRMQVARDPTTDGLVRVIVAAVNGGATAVVLREKDLSRSARLALAMQIRPIVDNVGGALVIASDATIESDGVHLAAHDPFPPRRRNPSGWRGWSVGRSCHSLDEVRAAEAEGCDYVTLSPIFESKSKPGYGPALGLDGLNQVVDEVAIPVFALGGVISDNAAECFDAGAAGIAVMGEIMRADDPAATVKRLLEAIADAGYVVSDAPTRLLSNDKMRIDGRSAIQRG